MYQMDGETMNQLAVAAKAYLDGGLSLVPINTKTKMPNWRLLPQKRNKDGELLFSERKATDDGGVYYVETTEDTGYPKGSWDTYAERQPTTDEVNRWLRSGTRALAMVTGAVSGDLEVLDFDNRQGETWFKEWCDLAGEPFEKHGLPLQATGGGGFQLAWRCDVTESSQKLAWIPAPEEARKRKAMIETRGRKAIALAPPSLHPSGNQYRLLSGRFSQTPRIDPELREFLLNCARKLNQVELPEPKAGKRTDYTGNSSNKVADAYNKEYPIEDVLRRYGYTQHGNRWSRPGKADSMGLAVFDDGKAYAFSSNDAMAADRCGVGDSRPFSSFDLFAYYDHNEDYSAATKAAAFELGMAYENNLHTLLYIEGYDNAKIARDLMFEHGWVVRGFRGDSVKTEGIEKYENIIVWSYSDALSRHVVTNILPRAYPLVVPNGMDAQTMHHDGILQPYLEAVLADAKKPAEVTTWTL